MDISSQLNEAERWVFVRVGSSIKSGTVLRDHIVTNSEAVLNMNLYPGQILVVVEMDPLPDGMGNKPKRIRVPVEDTFRDMPDVVRSLGATNRGETFYVPRMN